MLFGIALCFAAASNAAQAAQQALIPDLVPEGQRGRFSGVKAFFEAPLPLILVSFTIARWISAGNFWAGLGGAIVVVVVTAAITVLVRETPSPAAEPLNWQPFLRLVLMTGLFTALILTAGAGIRALGGALVDARQPAQIALMGSAGLLAMTLVVALGVWLCVRISIGRRAAQHNPSFTWWVINRLAFLVGVGNLGGFAVYFMQARLGIEREKAAGPAAILMLIVGVCILVAALPSGWLADRFGRKRLIGVSGGLAILGTVIVLASPVMTTMFIGGAVIGIATGFFYAANWALGTSLAPPHEAARYLGLANLAGAGAGAVGAYIGGPIADFFTAAAPASPGLGYVLLFTLYGALFGVSILALRNVHEADRPNVPGTSETPGT